VRSSFAVPLVDLLSGLSGKRQQEGGLRINLGLGAYNLMNFGNMDLFISSLCATKLTKYLRARR